MDLKLGSNGIIQEHNFIDWTEFRKKKFEALKECFKEKPVSVRQETKPRFESFGTSNHPSSSWNDQRHDMFAIWREHILIVNRKISKKL